MASIFHRSPVTPNHSTSLIVGDLSPNEVQASRTAKEHLQNPTWALELEIEHYKLDILVCSPVGGRVQRPTRGLKLAAVEVDSERMRTPVHANGDISSISALRPAKSAALKAMCCMKTDC